MRAPANPPAKPLGRLALTFVALLLATVSMTTPAKADEPSGAVDGEAAVVADVAGESAGAEGDAAPAADAASPEPAEAPTLAGYLSGGMLRVSADVVLISGDDKAIEPVVGSFTVDGLTYAIVGEGEVALVAVSPRTLAGGLAGGSDVGSDAEGAGEPVALALPEAVSYDGSDYSLTAIGPRALAGCDAAAVALPASVASVDQAAFEGSSVASVEVSEGNQHYSSYDGMLFDAGLTRLLLIPEGKQGAARIPKEAEVVDPSCFSHSAGVSSIDVEAGSAAYSSRNGSLYDASGNLLWAPPGSEEAPSLAAGDDGDGDGASCAAEGLPAASLGEAAASRNKYDLTLNAGGGTIYVTDKALTTLSSPSSSNLTVECGCTSMRVRLLPGYPGAIHFQHGADHSNNQYRLWVRPGYKVTGFRDVANSGDYALTESWLGMAGKARTLEPTWSPQSYTITLDANGGSMTKGTGGSQSAFEEATYAFTYKEGMRVSDIGDAARVARKGYRHLGWSLVVNGLGQGGGGVGGSSVSYQPDALFASSDKVDIAVARGQSVKLMACWRKLVRITWDTQGGSAIAPTDQEMVSPNMTNLAFPADPTRAGYAFAGWYTAATGGTKVEAPYRLPFQDTTYYARWEANVITITWDYNGGKVGSATKGTTSATYSASAKVPMATASPTRAGYRFAGWFTAASGGTQVSSKTALPASAITYHAHWVAEGPHVDVRFSGELWRSIERTLSGAVAPGKQGTSYRPACYASEVALRGGQLVISGVSDYEPAEELIYHVGFGSAVSGVESAWLVTADASGAKKGRYLGSSAASVAGAASADVYLNGAGAVTVTWDAQGGTVEPAKTAGVMPYAPVGALPTPTRAGYVFVGWFTAKSGGAQVSPSTLVERSITYYARWVAEGPSPRYHASQAIWRSIDWSDGGHSAAAQMGTTYSGDMTAATLRLSSERVDMAGATGGHGVTYHVGTTQAVGGVSSAWLVRTDASGARSGQALGSTAVSVSGLKAADVYLNGYGASTVTFDANGGSIDGKPTAQATGIMPYAPVGTLPAPTRAGHVFAGWFTARSGGAQVSSATLVERSATYYARWVAEGPSPRYHAPQAIWRSIDWSDGGHTAAAQMGTTYSGDLTAATLRLSSRRVDMEGATGGNGVTYHVGTTQAIGGVSSAWLVRTDASGARSGQALGSTAVSVSGLKAADVYLNGYGASTVTFDANGGSIDGKPTAQATGIMPYATLSGPVPAREGYAFRGWWDQPDGKGAQYCTWDGSGVRAWDKGADATLYAHWTKIGPRAIAHSPEPGIWRIYDIDDRPQFDFGLLTRYDTARWWLDGSVNRVRLEGGSLETDGLRSLHAGQEGRRLRYLVGVDDACAGVSSAWVVGTAADGSRQGLALEPGGGWADVTDLGLVDVYMNGAGNSTVTWDANGGALAQPDGSFAGSVEVPGVRPCDVVGDAPGPRRYGYAFAGWFDAPEGGSYVCGAGGSTGQVSASATLYAHWALITSVEVPIALDSASFELGVPDGTVRVAGTDGDALAPGYLRSSMPVEVAVEAVSCEAALDAAGASPGTPEAFWSEHAAFADLEVGPGEGAGGDGAGGDGAADGTAGVGGSDAPGAGDGPSSLAATGALSLRAGSSLAAPDLPPWLAIPAATGAPDGSMASLGELPLLYGLSLERLFADPAGGGAGVDIADLLPQAPGSGFAVPTGLLRVTFTVDATRYA